MKRLAITTGAFLAFLMSFIASAETPDETLASALKEFVRGEWEKAATQLRVIAPKLTDLKRRAIAWKTVGLAEIERRRVADAEAAFVEALTADPLVEVDPVEDTPAAVALFRGVRNRLEGRLAITTNHADARLLIDGTDLGALPFHGAIKIGRRQIRAATPNGHYEIATSVVIRVGENPPLRLKLLPTSKAPTRSTAAATSPTAIVRTERRRNTQPWAIGVLGVGVATILAGTFAYVLPATPSSSGLTRDEYMERVNSYNTTVKVGVGLLVGGGAALVSSGLLFALHRDSVGPKMAAHPTAAPQTSARLTGSSD
ncbi:MAG: hypothetical protein HYY84_09295 [Deltaproteobacteria bacterium]|nr:hypothetical protein [Deltaproteobacteria bacterium]